MLYEMDLGVRGPPASTGIFASSASARVALSWSAGEDAKALDMPAFIKYIIVGIFNTAIHVGVFTAMQVAGNGQALSNLVAFIIATSFSFLGNAWFTFRVPVSLMRYVVFVAGMGSISVWVGHLADGRGWAPWLTVGLFSLVSLLLGFAFARWVFREKRRWIFR